MTRYGIDPERSRLWIRARSNVHPIHTDASGLQGWVELELREGLVQLDEQPRGHLEFGVENLKSGNALEDRELQRRIDARRFPTITGDLKVIKHGPAPTTYVINGDLTFRGVTRSYEDVMTIETDAGTLKLAGQSTFDIRDFGMDPPRILLLKVYPDVTVQVDIVAEKEG